MNTITLIIFLLAVVSVLIGICGIGLLIFGLINKKKKMTISGSILTFLAIVMLISAVFLGARRVIQIMNQNGIKQECPFFSKQHGQCMEGDSLMIMGDSTHKDSCMMMDKKMMMEKCCKKGDMKNCDPSKCKKNCPHHQ
jgi:hypothetical protein